MKELTQTEFILDLTDIIYDRKDGICDFLVKDLKGEAAGFVLANLLEFSMYKYWALYTSLRLEMENNKKAPIPSDYYLYIKKCVHTEKELKVIFDGVLARLTERYAEDSMVNIELPRKIRDLYEQRFQEYDKVKKATDATAVMQYFAKLKDIFVNHLQDWPALSNGTVDMGTYTNRLTAYLNNTFSMVSSRVYYHPGFMDRYGTVVRFISTIFFFFVLLFIFRKLLASSHGDLVNSVLHGMTNGIFYLVIAVFVLIFLIIAYKLVAGRRK